MSTTTLESLRYGYGATVPDPLIPSGINELEVKTDTGGLEQVRLLDL